MIYVEVAVAAPVRSTYTYRLPPGLRGDDTGNGEGLIGRRVLAPFGNAVVTGYLIAQERQEPPAELPYKEIAELLDDSPLFPAELVPLFRWVADYYHHPLGLVIKTALPGGLNTAAERQLCLTENIGKEAVAAVCADYDRYDWLLQLLENGRLPAALSKKVLNERRHRAVVDRLSREKMLRIERRAAQDGVRNKYERCYRISDALQQSLATVEVTADAEAGQLADCIAAIGGRQPGKAERTTVATLWRLSRENGTNDVPRRELLAAYPYASRIVAGLAAAGAIEMVDRRVYRSPFGDLLPYYPPVAHLSPEQQEAVEAIGRCLDERRFHTFLLHGVTGSGKTEVYLAAAKKTLEAGRTVLVLVPEIALATQIEAHFVSRFGTLVALLHSALTPGERFDEWSRVLSGEARLVIGARSAVFAPLADLGLVVVDEEHDGAFKQQDGLRYQARDVAIVRASHRGATVILGSATPSVTSFFHGRSGKYSLLTLSRRIGGKQLPGVEVVDVRGHVGSEGTSLFHERLKTALQETFSQGQQSIVLINRRGFSPSVICLSCGTMVECRSCRVTMNLHKQTQRLLCHYCGYQLPSSSSCRSCGSTQLHPVGVGIERVAEALAELLPQARIARLDSDIAVDRRAFLALLQAASRKELDVLVGTQILAKGLHFPGVTLVGIVLADTGLAFPDFRAAEKTYQLIAQVTGRAGRGESHGRVIIQTMQPDHYAIQYAAQHRYQELAEREAMIRQGAGFPPFSRLIFIVVEDRDESLVRRRATEIAQQARTWVRERSVSGVLSIMGPAPAPLERLRDRHRWQIMLKGTAVAALHDLADHLSRTFQRSGREKIIIDVDPENML